jgi:AcrR family transcriptional regulator
MMPTHAPQHKVRMSAPERRAAIVEAAINLFSSQGFRGATTRQLAAAVGVSEPVLYQHFATKRALYDAILEAKTHEFREDTETELEAYSKAGDDRAFFTRLAGLLLDWYIKDPRYARLLMFSALEHHELSGLFFERHVVTFYQVVVSHLERQMKRGKIRKTDPLLAARAFAGMISHQGTIYAVYCPGTLPGGRDAIIKTVVDIFLKGISL